MKTFFLFTSLFMLRIWTEEAYIHFERFLWTVWCHKTGSVFDCTQQLWKLTTDEGVSSKPLRGPLKLVWGEHLILKSKNSFKQKLGTQMFQLLNIIHQNIKIATADVKQTQRLNSWNKHRHTLYYLYICIQGLGTGKNLYWSLSIFFLRNNRTDGGWINH